MRGERELLLDTSRKVFMIDRSDETVERGLLLAVLKWGGGKMQLTGSDEFIKQAITIAADKKIRMQRHLTRCHLDDVRFKQRRDDVGRDQVIGREQPSIADRTFEPAALHPILSEQVVGEAG